MAIISLEGCGLSQPGLREWQRLQCPSGHCLAYARSGNPDTGRYGRFGYAPLPVRLRRERSPDANPTGSGCALSNGLTNIGRALYNFSISPRGMPVQPSRESELKLGRLASGERSLSPVQPLRDRFVACSYSATRFNTAAAWATEPGRDRRYLATTLSRGDALAICF